MGKSNWPVVELGSICEVYDGPHATPKRTDFGPVFLGISSLDKGRLDLSKSDHLSDKDYVKWTRRITPKTGDIVFSYETRLGEAAIIPKGLQCALGRRMGLLRPNTEKVDPKFLLYSYLGPEFQKTIKQHSVQGSTVNRILISELPNYPITLPPLPEQRRIAHILGTLDDKIELNRRTNQTLEAIARAIFKSWFVDFAPVRAKIDGRPTGLPDHIADLFPASFEDSELGKIPGGWKVEHLSNIATVTDCLHAKKPEMQEEGPLLLQVFNIGQHGELDFSKTYPVLQEDYDYWVRRFEATPGDLIISKTGRVGAIAQIPNGFKGAMGRNLVGIRANPDYVLPGFLRDYMFSIAMKKEIARKTSQGTILNSLHVKNISIFDVLLPPIELVKLYEELIKPLHSQKEKNDRESRTLAEIRDTLLPRLMRGELRV